MAFTYRDMGSTFHKYILHIFRNGWMDCRDTFNAVVCLYYCVIAEYEAYWLILEACASHSSLQSSMLKLTICDFTGNRDHLN